MLLLKLITNYGKIKKWVMRQDSLNRVRVEVETEYGTGTYYIHKGIYKIYSRTPYMSTLDFYTREGIIEIRLAKMIDCTVCREEGLSLYMKILKGEELIHYFRKKSM